MSNHPQRYLMENSAESIYTIILGDAQSLIP